MKREHSLGKLRWTSCNRPKSTPCHVLYSPLVLLWGKMRQQYSIFRSKYISIMADCNSLHEELLLPKEDTIAVKRQHHQHRKKWEVKNKIATTAAGGWVKVNKMEKYKMTSNKTILMEDPPTHTRIHPFLAGFAYFILFLILAFLLWSGVKLIRHSKCIEHWNVKYGNRKKKQNNNKW